MSGDTGSTQEAYGLVANVLWDRVLRMGAKVYLLGWHGDYHYVFVQGLSKGGRTVRKYLPLKRLRTFRAAWLPPSLQEDAWCRFATKAEATATAARMEAFWAQVQFFSTDGVCLRAGIPVGEAQDRLKAERARDEYHGVREGI
jgi:hypothetical protein